MVNAYVAAKLEATLSRSFERGPDCLAVLVSLVLNLQPEDGTALYAWSLSDRPIDGTC